MTDYYRDIGRVAALNEHLRKTLELRRKFQQILDRNAADNDLDGKAGMPLFTLDGIDWYGVTETQRDILIGMATEDVRKLNERRRD